MINRQIEVLRHCVRSQETQISALLRREEDSREKLDRESSKLHDRVDRMLRQLDEQRHSAVGEEKFRTLDEKLRIVEEQMNLTRPSPMRDAISAVHEYANADDYDPNRQLFDFRLLHQNGMNYNSS